MAAVLLDLLAFRLVSVSLPSGLEKIGMGHDYFA